MTEPQARIHRENPFATPPELREPARRFRGRLVAPVTVWTSGAHGSYAGLSVSSVLVAEGEPPRVYGLVGPTTDLWDALDATGAFVVHVLRASDRVLADRFAGLRPSPGGVFAGLDVRPTPWGPAIALLADRACCRVAGAVDAGWHKLVEGVIENVELGDDLDPLAFFRGLYRRLS